MSYSREYSIEETTMSSYTRFHNLSEEELLNEVNKLRQFSPVIEALAQKIESRIDGGENECLCPVCEAKLEGKFSEDGLSLGVSNG